MKFSFWNKALLAAVLLGFSGLRNASAELPMLNDKPWEGYFAVFEDKHYQFGITAVGKAKLVPLNEKKKPVGSSSQVSILFGIEEVRPDGTTRMKKIEASSLESSDPATDKLEKVVIRGKVTGDAAFEFTIEQTHGVISMGGRVTDAGSQAKYPLRFTIRAKIPNVYSRDKKEERKDLKAFEKKIKRDRVDLKWTDGQRAKANLDETVDGVSTELNGPGISNAEIEMAAYKDNKFVFAASESSSIRLMNDKPGPLHEGFWLVWLPDAARDTEGKARFSFEMK